MYRKRISHQNSIDFFNVFTHSSYIQSTKLQERTFYNNALIKDNLNLRKRSWTNFDNSCYSRDIYVLGMKQYCTKLDKMIEINTEFPAQVGANTVNAIYDSIFNRIEALRIK